MKILKFIILSMAVQIFVLRVHSAELFCPKGQRVESLLSSYLTSEKEFSFIGHLQCHEVIIKALFNAEKPDDYILNMGLLKSMFNENPELISDLIISLQSYWVQEWSYQDCNPDFCIPIDEEVWPSPINVLDLPNLFSPEEILEKQSMDSLISLGAGVGAASVSYPLMMAKNSVTKMNLFLTPFKWNPYVLLGSSVIGVSMEWVSHWGLDYYRINDFEERLQVAQENFDKAQRSEDSFEVYRQIQEVAHLAYSLWFFYNREALEDLQDEKDVHHSRRKEFVPSQKSVEMLSETAQWMEAQNLPYVRRITQRFGFMSNFGSTKNASFNPQKGSL